MLNRRFDDLKLLIIIRASCGSGALQRFLDEMLARYKL
jgi:hypothetical protein